jgi:histidyl-tRNA synthetase
VADRYQTLRGFKDLLPGETEHWQRFENAARDLFRRYAFREIRPPCLEATELFVRSVGEVTDIVGKEMFTLQTTTWGPVTLRPEITASVCRAYVQHGLDRLGLSRLYYIGPAFRKETPQRGRYNQFHQAGVEVIGEAAPETDVEVIALGCEIVRAAGNTAPQLYVNSLGDGDDRTAYRSALIGFLDARRDVLCAECRERIERNPLRVLDCKNARCQQAIAGAPSILESLGTAAREHFDAVLSGLRGLGLEPIVEPRLVRGLDYYMRTTFEIKVEGGDLGAQNTVLGGGRYDNLIGELGGRPTPGIGWAAGIERLLIAGGLADRTAPAGIDAFVVTLGDAARARALSLVQALRGAGLAVAWDTAGHGLGGQMKRAGRSGARYAVLVGDDELARGAVTLKNLLSGEQSEGPGDPAALAALLKERC